MKIRERSERKLIPFSILYGTGQDNPVMGGRGEWGGGRGGGVHSGGMEWCGNIAKASYI